MALKKPSTSTPKVAAQPSAGPLLISANYITGAHLIKEDLMAKPYSRTVVDWLEACGLLQLCSLDVPEYSLLLADEFHKQMVVQMGTGKMKGTLRGHKISITAATVGQALGLVHDPALPMAITDAELKQAWNSLRPGLPMIGANFTRKEFSPEIYLLSDVVDKVFLCKTGNKDKFTEDQLRITAAIFLRRSLDWAGLLHSQICQSVLSVAMTGNPKRRFVRIINKLVSVISPALTTANREMIAHTAQKELNKTTLKFLEKVVPAAALYAMEPSEIPSEAPPTEAPTPAATPSSPAKAKGKGKGKRPADPTPPIPAKKLKKPIEVVETMTHAQIAAYTKTLQAELERLTAQSAANKEAESEAAGTVKAADEAGKQEPTTEARPKRKPKTRKIQTQPIQTPNPTTIPPQTPLSDYPTAHPIMSAEEARVILTKEYDSSFHDLPATFVRTIPNTHPDIIFPIAHLPSFVYNLLAFHFEGKESV